MLAQWKVGEWIRALSKHLEVGCPGWRAMRLGVTAAFSAVYSKAQ